MDSPVAVEKISQLLGDNMGFGVLVISTVSTWDGITDLFFDFCR